MNKWLFIFLIVLIPLQISAFDLDLTVDDDIRKNYNPSKLIQDVGIDENEELPTLPEISKYENKQNNTQTYSPQKQNNIINLSQQNNKSSVKIGKGKSFDVVNMSKISDWQTKGTSVKFKTTHSVAGKKYTLPAGTIFYGEIIDSHQPQITCNGGLVVIKIHSVNYQGKQIPIQAYITQANGEKIFFNNIKGDRTYLKTMWKKGNWGRTIFNKMLSLTINLGNEGSTLLFSPFPFAYGTICLGLNTLTSPICAFFSKGGHVSIPAGSAFKIKFMNEVHL